MAIFNNGIGLMARRLDHDGNLRSGKTKPSLHRIMLAEAGELQIYWRKCSWAVGRNRSSRLPAGLLEQCTGNQLIPLMSVVPSNLVLIPMHAEMDSRLCTNMLECTQ